MKITQHFDVSKEDLHEFLDDIVKRTDLAVKDFTIMTNSATDSFHITTEVDYTDYEYRMLTIRTIINTNSSLTDDEKNALEYAISCIKTLADMGVIS